MLPYLDDIFQFTNPIIGLYIATERKQDNEYILNYAATMAITGGGKYLGKRFNYPGSLRPDHTSYTGMPSGHTSSAWFAAAHTRSIPLYMCAYFTACARVVRKKHTWYQVGASIALAEGIVFVSKYWNKHFGLMAYDSGIAIRYRF